MLKHCIRRCMVGIVLVSLGISAVYAQDITGGGQNLTNAAQNGNTGKVIGDYGQPLADVVISAQDGKTLDTTKDDGTFNLPEVALGQKLIFICKNFDIRVVVVENTTNMIVKMHDSYLKKEANPELLYSRKNQKDAVGSNASVYTRQLQTTPTSLYLNALTGRLAGFYTEETSGFRSALTTGITYHDLAGQLPSSGTKYTSNNTDNTEMNISLRGQTPVTIVDGVQRDIYSLDPENIESITVLKDALSTILLGQKSSRGVLQVITKKGVAGPPRISFTVESGVQSRLKTPTPLSSYQYAYLYNEALQNDGKIRAYSDVDFYGFRSGSSPYKYPDVNWYNTILKDYAPMTKCNLNVSGGIKNARYSMSVSYLNQQGMFKEASDVNYNTNLSLNRYLINSSVDIDVTKNFTVGLQLFGRIQDGNQPGAGTSTVLSKLYTTPNNAYPVLNPDGSYGGSSDYTVNLYQQTTGSGYLLDNSRDLMANLDLKYKFNQWLPGLYASVKVNTSSTSSSLISRSIVKPVYDVSIADDGTVSYTRYGTTSSQTNTFNITSTVQQFYAQGAVGYDYGNDKHKFGVMLFADQQRSTYQFDLPETYTNFAATANYNFRQRYSAEIALDYGGFDRFEPGKQYGMFYAGGLGWTISEEPFMKNAVKWIDLLKIRGTYGETGNSNENSLGYFTWRSAFGQDGNNTYQTGTGDSYTSGIVEQTLANTTATWEKAHKFDAGIDMALFQSHLTVTADYYRDIYYDLLQQRGSSVALLGFTYPNENIGKNLYTGQELTITYQNHIGNFNYYITGNASRMKTEVLFMDELEQKYDWNKHTGMPVGQTFGYLANGLIQTQEEANNAPLLAGTKVYPGDVKLVDLNKDGVIDRFDQTAIGNTKPIIYYGTTIGFSFKGINWNVLGLNFEGIDGSVLLQGVKNRTYQQTDYSFGSGGKDQGYDYLIGRWTPETAATATYPRLTVGFNANNTPYLNNSSYWTRSGEYFRVKNVDIGLTFSLKNPKAKLGGVRIFANAQNLFTHTPYDRLDPEVHSSTSYPIQRIINMGVNIKF